MGRCLFNVADAPISFPMAQNTHAYEDAHRALYGILVDGLDKASLGLLGDRLGRRTDISQMRGPTALKTILPGLKANAVFEAPIENVSKQRALSSHGVRPPATAMRAFEAFSDDLSRCLQAAQLLRGTLESELHMDAEPSLRRQDALARVPRIGAPPLPNYSINEARAMVGKTVERVDVGSRPESQTGHQSEVMIIHFTDGSIMSIESGCNAQNFHCEKHPPHEFHVDFIVQWVPPAT